VDVPSILRAIVVVAAAYVIGSIPWAVIVARVTGGQDPRKIGSGRTGGSNAVRALGRRRGVASGLLDAAKGSVAVLLAFASGAGTLVAVLAALAAIIGHSRSVFLHFGGGRGIAPSFGALLVIEPVIAVAILPVFLGMIWLTKYSSVGSLSASLLAGVLLAVLTAVLPLDPWLYVYAVAGPLLIWAFHHDNIARLMAGTERKVGTPRT
jgi:glycerol-3-phosphate acyltransferase PlsY